MTRGTYDFYPCLVDDAPASIYVDLRYEDAAARPATADTRYWIEISMLDPGAHGIGTADEADVLNALEEAAIARLASAALAYVGRVRHRGTWETSFYGPAGHLRAIDQAAEAFAPRRVSTGTRPDLDWSYYRELLLPDLERKQWMDDRRLVEILREQGDRLALPRRVDHRASFTSAQARDAFATAAAQHGFTRDDAETATAEPVGERSFLAHVFRVDPIELDHIHDVVMILVDAAVEHGGVYERWESSIESG